MKSFVLFLVLMAWVSGAHAAICPKSGSVYSCSNTGVSTTNAGNFAETLGNASCGDTITIAAGSVLSNFAGISGNPIVTLPNKNCTQYITIQSSGAVNLPANKRVSYADIPNMVTFQTANNNATIAYKDKAGYYKWIGILFTTTNRSIAPVGFVPALVMCEENGGGSMHHIIYDRVIVRPFEESMSNPDSASVRSAGFGIRLDGRDITMTNSQVKGFCCRQTDAPNNAQSVAVSMVTGRGPYTLINNEIEAYGWNIFTGGGGDGEPADGATLSGVSGTTATFSNITNLKIGDIIRLDFATPFLGTCWNAGNLQPNNKWAAGIVDAISGTTVTWHYVGPGGSRPPAGSAPPTAARWNPQGRMAGFTVRNNLIIKRSTWTQNSGQCKSFWEMKDGSDVLFEGNIVTGPVDGTGGVLCPMNTAFATNQAGANPWVRSTNNIFRNNLMLGVGSIFSSVYDSYCYAENTMNITFTNNLMGKIGNRFSWFVNNANGCGWNITHNTVRGNTNSIFHSDGSGKLTCNINLKDNIIDSGGYYINPWKDYPGLVVDGNLIVDNTGACNGSPPYCNGYIKGSKDRILANATSIGFANIAGADAGGDYHGYMLVGNTSCTPGNWKGCASDGTDPGVNFQMLDAALAGNIPIPPTNLPPSTPSNVTVR